MKPVHFVFVGLILAGATVPAQFGSKLPAHQVNEMLAAKEPQQWTPNSSPAPQAMPFARRSAKAVKPRSSGDAIAQSQWLSFANAVPYGSGADYSAISVAVADVNGDGKPDIVVANNCGRNCEPGSDDTVGVRLGNGDGTFQTAVNYDSGGSGALSVAVADLRGNGTLDLVVTNASVCADSTCASGVSVLLGNGDGTFQTATSYPLIQGSPYSVAVADVNGDGKPDIIVATNCDASNCSGDVNVLLGNGDGTFKAAVSYSSDGYSPFSVVVGDLRGNGKADIIVANQCVAAFNFSCANPSASPAGSIAVLLGNGDGTFQPAVTYGSGGYNAMALAVRDVNGDGKLDVLVGNSCSTPCPEGGLGVVGVLLGNGDGTLQPAVAYDSGGAGPYSIAVADVNGDGKLDVVATNPGAIPGSACGVGLRLAVDVLLGNGDGTLQSPVDYCLINDGLTPYSVAVADLNGDGKPDLVVANGVWEQNNSLGVVDVLINTSMIIGFSPSSLNFGSQALGSSTPQNVMLVNTGNWNTTIDISSIVITGANSTDFSQTNNCPSSFARTGSCNVSVTYAPTSPGTQNASLTVGYNASGSPQSVPMTGFASGAIVSLSPSGLTFPAQYVGTSGLPQTVTVTNTGNATLNVSKVTTSVPDLGTLSNCTNPVGPGQNCTIGVFFDPTTSGSRSGALVHHR
jgi:FG-GAP-like repeat/Abnormal spindle-like microcephaly-assoc'd, ASPM-SPD-2-Hydin